MSKYNFGNGQYIVYANDEQEAMQIITQELKRFDTIKEQMANLLTEKGQEWQKFMANTSEEKLNIHFNDKQSAIFDREGEDTKGEVRQRSVNNGEISYDLAYRYPDIDGQNANFRLAHEMGHLMLNPSKTIQQVYDEKSNSTQVAGLIRRNEKTGQLYGEEIQENAINLLAQLAIRGNTKADDIINGNVDFSEYNSYKKCDELVKLLAISMRNDKKMTFEQLAEQKIDSIIMHPDGTQEPANTFFYGILNDSSLVENEFDKYLGNGAWKELNEAFSQLYNRNTSKEKFELILQNAKGLIKEFENIRYQDKFKQQTNSMTENYTINEFGEIIRPAREEQEEKQTNENKLSIKQKVAQFLQKKNIFMNMTFVKNFVEKQLNVLPSPSQGTRTEFNAVNVTNNNRIYFLNELTHNGELRNLPPIQTMSDPQRIEAMRRKIQQDRQNNNGNER